MVRDCKRLRQNYFKSASWRTDILSCLPTDIFYLIWPPGHCHFEKLPCPVVLRLNRLFRLPRMMEFCDKTETKTGYPNVFRICKVVFAILILIHWNSCFYFGISYLIGFGKDSWVYNLGGENSTLSRQYIYCFYWSTLTLTTIGKWRIAIIHMHDSLILYYCSFEENFSARYLKVPSGTHDQLCQIRGLENMISQCWAVMHVNYFKILIFHPLTLQNGSFSWKKKGEKLHEYFSPYVEKVVARGRWKSIHMQTCKNWHYFTL